MNAFNHTMQELFSQLGLPNSETDIDDFIEAHRVPAEISLEDAAFWNAGQTQFIREAITRDAAPRLVSTVV
jgi:hypothetical protein